MEEEAIGALSMIAGVTPTVAQTMYKLGFRSLDEVAEAQAEELAGIPGLGGAENAERIKSAAEVAMEELRQKRIRDASARTEPLTERERLLFVRGVGEHTIGLLANAGVHTVEQLHATAEETLLRETGLGLRKVRQIKSGASMFLGSESKVIDEARKQYLRDHPPPPPADPAAVMQPGTEAPPQHG
jgi:N utilization substance protein A